jgi:hypothetical protein
VAPSSNPVLLVASKVGLWRDGELVALQGQDVTYLTNDGDGWLAVADHRRILRLSRDLDIEQVVELDAYRVRCVGRFDGELIAGTYGAHLVATGLDTAPCVDTLEEAPGRDTWYSPHGGPAAVRSIDQGPDGLRWVNVHVGGVLVSDGGPWRSTMDIENDVHQVLAHPDRAGVALVAAAVGLGMTTDGGSTWVWTTDGLHAAYSRALAVSGDTVLLTVSNGPRGGRAAVYRGEIGGRLERCTRTFGGNIQTNCLSASDRDAAFLTARGHVMVSPDLGDTWERAFRVPSPRGLAYAG